MLKISNLEQIKNINLDEDKIFYIYGKIGSGKTYFAKKITKINNKEAFYTNFYEIIQAYTQGEELQIENKEVIIIDDEIKTVIEKEFTCLTLQRILEKMQDDGKILLVISNLLPKQLKQKNKLLAEFVLQGEQIEICYDIQNRTKIAEEYSKQCETTINKNILQAIAKESNIGKIKGSINQMNIQY